jgi:hypothetical protein
MVLEAAVARVESQVIQLYKMAALCARREMDLSNIEKIWEAVVAVCDTVARTLQTLCTEHSCCVASHAKILTIRNKAARLRDLHGS